MTLLTLNYFSCIKLKTILKFYLYIYVYIHRVVQLTTFRLLNYICTFICLYFPIEQSFIEFLNEGLVLQKKVFFIEGLKINCFNKNHSRGFLLRKCFFNTFK